MLDNLIGAPPRFCVVRVPEPGLLRLAANEAPLLIKFTDKRHISMGYRR